MRQAHSEHKGGKKKERNKTKKDNSSLGGIELILATLVGKCSSAILLSPWRISPSLLWNYKIIVLSLTKKLVGLCPFFLNHTNAVANNIYRRVFLLLQHHIRGLWIWNTQCRVSSCLIQCLRMYGLFLSRCKGYFEHWRSTETHYAQCWRTATCEAAAHSTYTYLYSSANMNVKAMMRPLRDMLHLTITPMWLSVTWAYNNPSFCIIICIIILYSFNIHHSLSCAELWGVWGYQPCGLTYRNQQQPAESLIQHWCASLDCGRKPERPEGPSVDTGWACTLNVCANHRCDDDDYYDCPFSFSFSMNARVRECFSRRS